ncbi:hypothetical protein ACHQM5_010495 [Ranunculus cassubicifolius]
MRRREQDEESKAAFNELCSLILTIINSPSHSLLPIPIPFTNNNNNNDDQVSSQTRAMAMLSSKQVSPAGFACLLLGVSLTLMLCGSVTFLLGFILMPWVLGFLLFFYFLGVVSTLSGLGRAILYPPSPKEMSVGKWKIFTHYESISLFDINSIGEK